MSTIWKYNVGFSSHIISVPKGTIPISVHSQNDIAVFWALVPDLHDVRRDEIELLVVETGDSKPTDGYTFLGTVLTDNTMYVRHVFYKIIKG